jgi:outer membrane biosynthesis protein TonB
MAKVICTRPNAGEVINGVKFTLHKDDEGKPVGMISEEVTIEQAEHFMLVPGFDLVEEEEVAQPTHAPTPAPTRTPTPKPTAAPAAPKKPAKEDKAAQKAGEKADDPAPTPAPTPEPTSAPEQKPDADKPAADSQAEETF